MTTAALLSDMPPKTHASRAGFRQAVRRWIVRKTGQQPVDVATDEAGNCKLCGEAGRCSGWHTRAEFADAVSRMQEGYQ